MRIDSAIYMLHNFTYLVQFRYRLFVDGKRDASSRPMATL